MSTVNKIKERSVSSSETIRRPENSAYKLLISEFAEILSLRLSELPNKYDPGRPNIFDKRFVERLIRDGYLTYKRDKGGRRRFNESDIETILAYFKCDVIEDEDSVIIYWESLLESELTKKKITTSQLEMIERRVENGKIWLWIFGEEDELYKINKYKAIWLINIVKDTDKTVTIWENGFDPIKELLP